MIAAIALHSAAVLLTADHDFLRLARVVPLQLDLDG